MYASIEKILYVLEINILRVNSNALPIRLEKFILPKYDNFNQTKVYNADKICPCFDIPIR